MSDILGHIVTDPTLRSYFVLQSILLQQYPIEGSFIQKWMVPVVEPAISCLNKMCIFPVEVYPVFKDSVHRLWCSDHGSKNPQPVSVGSKFLHNKIFQVSHSLLLGFFLTLVEHLGYIYVLICSLFINAFCFFHCGG